MRGITGLKLNLPGINQIMASASVQRIVDEEGNAMQRRAGANFEYVASPHKWTARGFVQPANADGAGDEARDKRLTRAI